MTNEGDGLQLGEQEPEETDTGSYQRVENAH